MEELWAHVSGSKIQAPRSEVKACGAAKGTTRAAPLSFRAIKDLAISHCAVARSVGKAVSAFSGRT
jgi:hypothetical protein